MKKTINFPLQIQAVSAWLEESGAADVVRENPSLLKWRVINSNHPALQGSKVYLVLPESFPAQPARIELDKTLCLILPHVEENGNVCLGAYPEGVDYEYPIQAVCRVLQSFQSLLDQALSPEWIRQELQQERLAYWNRFCHQLTYIHLKSTPYAVYVTDLPQMLYGDGLAAFYRRPGKKTLEYYEVVIASAGAESPEDWNKRHALAHGTLIHGKALFVKMPDEFPWTPSHWPTDFSSLDTLVTKLTAQPNLLQQWLCKQSKKDSTPLLLILVAGSVQYAYQVHRSHAPLISPPVVAPLPVTRIDSAWSLTRDHNLDVFQQRKARKILVLGCGSLGSPIIELLARAGIGEIDAVDYQTFESENCSRHVLGMCSLGRNKATAMASRLIEEIPGVIVNGISQHASDWVLNHCRPGQYSLIVDCTAESSVRCLLGQVRNTTFAECPIVHAWLEPFCAAAHVVLLANEDMWPANDPADTINAAEWPPNLDIKLPACGVGFHPYGVADVWQAAGFAAERILQIVDKAVTSSTVWSWIRSKAYFESLGYPLQLKAIVPNLPSATDVLSTVRQFHDVLSSNSQ